jgi:hypothetical protein
MHRALLLAFLALAGCSTGSGVCSGGVESTPHDLCDSSSAVIPCAATYEEQIVYAC